MHLTPLTVTSVDHGTEESIFMLGKRRIKISRGQNVLIGSGFVTVQQIKKGDKILAWSFAKPEK